MDKGLEGTGPHSPLFAAFHAKRKGSGLRRKQYGSRLDSPGRIRVWKGSGRVG